MHVLIKQIMDKKKAAEIIVANCDKAIKSIQELCEHNYIDRGHSHNDTLYVCLECGKEKWR